MSEKIEKKKFRYLYDFADFYFSPKVRSVLTIPHFIVWSFIATYYSDYVVVAIQFFFYTAFTSNVLLSFTHLLWSIAFIHIFALPFVIANYAIFSIHRIWREHLTWSIPVKWLMSILAVVGVFLTLYILDGSARFVSSQNELRNFIEDVGLNGRI
jgi:hypothetical protein